MTSEIEDRFKWSKQKQLDAQGFDYFYNKNYKKAEKFYLKALKAKDDNLIDRHFLYNHLIELYYRIRAERKDALEKCIFYCKEDIKNLPDFFKADEKQQRDQRSWSESLERKIGWEGEEKEPYEYIKPMCPSVVQLAIIYEKQGNFQDAIEICKHASELGLDDGTKGGFEGRIKRLEKKINST